MTAALSNNQLNTQTSEGEICVRKCACAPECAYESWELQNKSHSIIEQCPCGMDGEGKHL